MKAYEAKFGPRFMFASLAWDAMKIVEAAVPTALKGGQPGTEKFRAALRDAIEGKRRRVGLSDVADGLFWGKSARHVLDEGGIRHMEA